MVENATNYSAKLLDVSRVLEVYNEYALQYEEGNAVYTGDIVNMKESECFDDVTIVNGLWTSDTHASIISNYLYSINNIGSSAYAPYIAGTNAPEFDAYAKGVFFGITASHDQYDLALAVMEGVAHLLAKNINFINQTQNTSDTIISTGGGTKSELWCQLKANVTHKQVMIITAFPSI